VTIISHEHRFIFLKTKKTAGTSIELALSQLCGPDDIIAPLTAIDEALRASGRGAQNWRRHGWWQSPRPLWERRWFKLGPPDYGYYNHMTAAEVADYIGPKIWASYFKFAVDRNPWDRQVSHYHFRHRGSKRPPAFDEFLSRDRRARLNNYEIYSIDRTPCVDFLGRFETLERDFAHVLRTLGIDVQPELPRSKSSFRPHKPYQDYYDERTEKLIGDWYQSEIALLGYSFR
jgi:Sulfotransferase family